MASPSRNPLRQSPFLVKAVMRSLRSAWLLEQSENASPCCRNMLGLPQFKSFLEAGLATNQRFVHSKRSEDCRADRVIGGREVTKVDSSRYGFAATAARIRIGIRSGISCIRDVATSAPSILLGSDANASVDEKGDGTGMGALQVAELERMLQELLAEASPDYTKIGKVSLNLGLELGASGADPGKVLEFANRALNILEEADSDSMDVGLCLCLIAIVYYQMGRQGRCVAHLNRAQKFLEDKHGEECNKLMYAVYFLSGNALMAMGIIAEALSCYAKAISLQESMVEANHPHLANTYRHVAQAYSKALQFREAIDFGNKALDVDVKHFGQGSMEEAVDRRLLSTLHSAILDYTKALDHQRRVLEIVKTKDSRGYDHIAAAHLEINLGRYDDAIFSLVDARSDMVPGSLDYSLASVCLAKAYVRKNKRKEAKKLCNQASCSFGKLADSRPDGPIEVAEGLSQLATVYAMMGETADAIKALKQSLTLSERIPGQILLLSLSSTNLLAPLRGNGFKSMP